MITRIKSETKPNVIEPLGNGIWYYNYDIREEEIYTTNSEGEQIIVSGYSYINVRIQGRPTYEKCVKALIREYIDINSELDIINSYNSYQLDINQENTQYKEYLQLIREIKDKVNKDFPQNKVKPKGTSPKQSDIIKLLLMTINTMSLTDQQSLEVKSLYPNWEDFIGKELSQGTKVQYQDRLFKVLQTHTAQEDWKPGIDTASLYTEIVEDHAGTLEDPIPYPADGNMIIYNGKYYVENGIIYLCIRDSQQPLYVALSSVIDNYVQIAQQL